MANKKLVKKKTGGENPKLKEAVKDSAQARSVYNAEYANRLNNPSGKPFTAGELSYYQKKFDKPGEVRSKMTVKKMGGAVKSKTKSKK